MHILKYIVIVNNLSLLKDANAFIYRVGNRNANEKRLKTQFHE